VLFLLSSRVHPRDLLNLMIHNSKLLVVLGPTSSGKSELAVKLAKKFNGEIISCDSRQIYRGMDLGTGKIKGRWVKTNSSNLSYKSNFVYKSIPHHLIDFQNPARQYSVARFGREAKKIIADIIRRGRLPILCGGTMHWIDAVVYNQIIPNVKPDPKLRAKLEKQPADVLFKRLLKLDSVRAKTIDRFNKRRLVRALEIVISTGNPVPQLATSNSQLETLLIGITLPQTDLYKKIDRRLKQRIKQGMIKEVQNLHHRSLPLVGRVREGVKNNGLSWKKLESFGLEYKYISQYLQSYPASSPLVGEVSRGVAYKKMLSQLSYAIKHYSRRQLTWWKRNNEIKWIKPDIKKAVALTKKFLTQKEKLVL